MIIPRVKLEVSLCWKCGYTVLGKPTLQFLSSPKPQDHWSRQRSKSENLLIRITGSKLEINCIKLQIWSWSTISLSKSSLLTYTTIAPSIVFNHFVIIACSNIFLTENILLTKIDNGMQMEFHLHWFKTITGLLYQDYELCRNFPHLSKNLTFATNVLWVASYPKDL